MVKDTFFRFWHEFRFYSKWFKLATFFVLLQLLFAIIYIFPYSEATPSRELTRLDLPLENFGFKVLYRPNEQYLRSTNAVLPSVVRAAFNETNDLPYQVKFEYSSLLPDADFLLRNTTFASFRTGTAQSMIADSLSSPLEISSQVKRLLILGSTTADTLR